MKNFRSNDSSWWEKSLGNPVFNHQSQLEWYHVRYKWRRLKWNGSLVCLIMGGHIHRRVSCLRMKRSLGDHRHSILFCFFTMTDYRQRISCKTYHGSRRTNMEQTYKYIWAMSDNVLSTDLYCSLAIKFVSGFMTLHRLQALGPFGVLGQQIDGIGRGTYNMWW